MCIVYTKKVRKVERRGNSIDYFWATEGNLSLKSGIRTTAFLHISEMLLGISQSPMADPPIVPTARINVSIHEKVEIKSEYRSNPSNRK
jgi:hypothetical protein